MDIDFSAVTGFIADHSAWAMPIIFLVVFCESFAFLSLLVPGTAFLAVAGTLVGTGALSMPEVLAAAIPAATLGDAISYWLGRRFGPRIIGAWPLRNYPEMVAKGEDYLQRYGALSEFIGRFFGPLRAVVPLMAGMARMPAGPFMLANVVSALVWAPVVLLSGSLLGWLAQLGLGGDPRVLAGVGLAALGAVAYAMMRPRA